MTLGATPQPADIVAELGESFPYTFPDARTRWLADVGVSSAITFPTSFANKTSVKVVATRSEAAGGGTSHTFTGVDFGAAFSGRVLVACVGLYDAASTVLDQTSVTIGGSSATGGDAGENLGSGPSCGAGVWARALNSGTSGDVVVNWSGGAADNAGLILLSVASIPQTAHDQTTGGSGGGSGGTGTGNLSLNIPSNGVLIAAVAHANNNNATMSGVTERQALNFGGARLEVGFNNRKSSQTGDTVSASWSGSTAYGMEARSYAQ